MTCYEAIYQRAHAEVLAWTPAPFPKSAAPVPAVERRVGPGFPDPVDRQAPAPGFSPRGGRRIRSLMPLLVTVAVPLSAGIYAGRWVRP